MSPELDEGENTGWITIDDDDDSRLLSLIRSRICRLWYKKIHPTSYPTSMVHKHDVALGPWVVLNIPSRAGCYVKTKEKEVMFLRPSASPLHFLPSYLLLRLSPHSRNLLVQSVISAGLRFLNVSWSSAPPSLAVPCRRHWPQTHSRSRDILYQVLHFCSVPQYAGNWQDHDG